MIGCNAGYAIKNCYVAARVRFEIYQLDESGIIENIVALGNYAGCQVEQLCADPPLAGGFTIRLGQKVCHGDRWIRRERHRTVRALKC